MTDQKRLFARLALAASALIAGGAAVADPLPVQIVPSGHWIGAGVQVDWLGKPLELPRIEVDFRADGVATIDYPGLGCSGTLTRVPSPHVLQYRETLVTGMDKCPSGALVSFRQAGDRLVYNWTVQSDWSKPDALASQGIPSQPGTGPDGDWVRSGVLTGDIAHPQTISPRNPSASVEDRIARVENWLVPPVVVKGEAAEKATLVDRMAALHVPGVSIAVLHHGKIDWAKSYGVSGPSGAPVTPDTLFQAASISKPVTALVTMRLAAEKKVDLDIDVDNYLNGWKLPRDNYASSRDVTIRRLLNHTGGVSVHGFAGYAANGPIPTLDQILSGEKPSNSPPFRIDTLPGTLWRYSGGGYVVIRKALENVTGDSFAKLALQYVLAPAGMTHSSFEQPLSAAAMKSAAWPYGGDGQPLKEGAHVYPEVAPDGLWTTATDLAKLTIQVQQALNGAPNAILPQAMTREMLEPGGLAGWGLGWGLGGSAAAPYFWHSGSNAGYKSMLFAYRNGDGAIVMTNSDTGEKLASDIVRTIAYEYGWPDFRPLEIAPVALSTQQLDALTGRYRVGRFGLLAISRKDGRLFAQMPGESAFRIYPRSRTEWFADNPDGFFPNTSTQISFHAGEVVVRKNSADIVAPRMSDAQADKIARDLAARIAAKAPLPNSEKILRGYIAGMQSGTPDYDAMSPGAAWITRLILLNFAQDTADLGALRAVTFQGVAPTGADNYAVTFEHGSAVAQIICAPDGKIEMVYLMSPTFM